MSFENMGHKGWRDDGNKIYAVDIMLRCVNDFLVLNFFYEQIAEKREESLFETNYRWTYLFSFSEDKMVKRSVRPSYLMYKIRNSRQCNL